MHGFYIEPPADGLAALPAEEAKHAAKVLRLRPGDEVCAMDGAGGRWRARIAEIDGSRAFVRLTEPLESHEPPVRLTVYQGLPKADKLDFIVQKLTELGAAALVPVKMERCVVKPEGRDGEKRRERLERIVREAAKQCGRGLPLRVFQPLGWNQALADMAQRDLLLVPWEEARVERMKDVFAQDSGARDIGIVVGPEGGMSRAEVEAMLAIGARAITLGPRILRAETASVASAALAMQLWGDL